MARARGLGAAGADWLAVLPARVDDLARHWDLRVGRSLLGGTASWAGRVRREDGSTAVLKVAMPQPGFRRAVEALIRADGRGYVRLLDHDVDRHAVLLEELGPIPDPGVEDHVVLMRRGARVLRVAWEVAGDPREPGAPAENPKVAVLHRLIADELAELTRLGEPLPGAAADAVQHARRLLDRRARAWVPQRAVVVHGDAHLANMLPVRHPRPGAVEGHVLVDPEAYVGDPAYDLGVLVRDWTGPLLASPDPGAEMRGWCRMLAAEAGADEEAVWEWGFVERVTLGLHLLASGPRQRGRAFLDVATRLR